MKSLFLSQRMAGLPSGLSEKDLKVQVSSLLVKTWVVRVLENLESPEILLWHSTPGKGYWSWKIRIRTWNKFLMKRCGLT